MKKSENRYRIKTRLIEVNRTMTWLIAELERVGEKASHLGEYVSGERHGDTADRVLKMADKILTKLEKGE